MKERRRVRQARNRLFRFGRCGREGFLCRCGQLLLARGDFLCYSGRKGFLKRMMTIGT